MSARVQYILIIGALLLLSQLSLSVSGFIIGMQDLSYDNEAILAATSLAQSVLHNVTAKNFDEVTTTKKLLSADSLTYPETLGPDPGETYATFDDVDDYNGYSDSLATDRLGGFEFAVTVNYATLVGAPSPTRTFLKAVSITVGGRYLTQNENIVLNTIVSY